MSEPEIVRPAFLATGRGGHSADPLARCPHCGQPIGTHQGVDLTLRNSWFPLRAIICDPARDGGPHLSPAVNQFSTTP